MAQHIGTSRIFAASPIFPSLCCIRFHCIGNILYCISGIKRGSSKWPSIIASSNCLLNHAQTLPSLTKKKTENVKSVSRDTVIADETVETPLINHGESLDYGTTTATTVQVQSSPSASTTTVAEEKPPLLNRGLIMIYLNLASLAFCDMGHFVLLPLFYSTSIPLGGLGLDPYKIGITLGSFGFINAIVQAKFLGLFIRKLGARKMYIICFPGLFGCIAMYPILRYFAQHSGRVNNIVIICMMIQLGFGMLIFASYGIHLYSL